MTVEAVDVPADDLFFRVAWPSPLLAYRLFPTEASSGFSLCVRSKDRAGPCAAHCPCPVALEGLAHRHPQHCRRPGVGGVSSGAASSRLRRGRQPRLRVPMARGEVRQSPGSCRRAGEPPGGSHRGAGIDCSSRGSEGDGHDPHRHGECGESSLARAGCKSLKARERSKYEGPGRG